MNPTCFGRYVLIDRLAAGGMGEVYIAVPRSLWGMDQLFAIKKILPSLSDDAEFLARFRDEAKLVIPLNHPNVVSVFEVGRVGEDYFISMEYVEGASVAQLLSRWWQLRRRLSLPVVAAMYIVRELLAGLAYCHSRKGVSGASLELIHRDICPENVLLSFDGAVKLADFGLASHRGRGTRTDPACVLGHLGYISPEAMAGQQVDQRADLFSTGVLLFELLTCERFLPVCNLGDIRGILPERCRLRPSRLRAEIPPALDAVVARALALDPAERYPSARAFHDDLQALLERLDPLFDCRGISQSVMYAVFHPGRRRRLLRQRLQAVDLEELEEREQLVPGRRTVCIGEAIPVAYENTAEQHDPPPLLTMMDDASVPETQPELRLPPEQQASAPQTAAGLAPQPTLPLLPEEDPGGGFRPPGVASERPAVAAGVSPSAPRRRRWVPVATYLGPGRRRLGGRGRAAEKGSVRSRPLFIEAKTDS